MMPDETRVRSTKAARRRFGAVEPEEGFLNRWSRRKEAVRDGEEVEVEPEQLASIEDAQTPEPEPEVVEELTADDLPDIETLEKDSDYTAFLKAGVPEALQRQALAKLWRSDPALANLDELLDYGENFATEGMITGPLQTAYKVGEGYFKKIMKEDPEEAEMPVAGLSEEAAEPAEEPAETEEVASAQMADSAEIDSDDVPPENETDEPNSVSS